MTTDLPDTHGSTPAPEPLALKSNEGLGPVPRWWYCDTHGPGKHNAWGCPECVRKMRAEIRELERAAAGMAELLEGLRRLYLVMREQPRGWMPEEVKAIHAEACELLSQYGA